MRRSTFGIKGLCSHMIGGMSIMVGVLLVLIAGVFGELDSPCYPGIYITADAELAKFNALVETHRQVLRKKYFNYYFALPDQVPHESFYLAADLVYGKMRKVICWNGKLKVEFQRDLEKARERVCSSTIKVTSSHNRQNAVDLRAFLQANSFLGSSVGSLGTNRGSSCPHSPKSTTIKRKRGVTSSDTITHTDLSDLVVADSSRSHGDSGSTSSGTVSSATARDSISPVIESVSSEYERSLIEFRDIVQKARKDAHEHPQMGKKKTLRLDDSLVLQYLGTPPARKASGAPAGGTAAAMPSLMTTIDAGVYISTVNEHLGFLIDKNRVSGTFNELKFSYLGDQLIKIPEYDSSVANLASTLENEAYGSMSRGLMSDELFRLVEKNPLFKDKKRGLTMGKTKLREAVNEIISDRYQVVPEIVSTIAAQNGSGNPYGGMSTGNFPFGARSGMGTTSTFEPSLLKTTGGPSPPVNLFPEESKKPIDSLHKKIAQAIVDSKTALVQLEDIGPAFLKEVVSAVMSAEKMVGHRPFFGFGEARDVTSHLEEVDGKKVEEKKTDTKLLMEGNSTETMKTDALLPMKATGKSYASLEKHSLTTFGTASPIDSEAAKSDIDLTKVDYSRILKSLREVLTQVMSDLHLKFLMGKTPFSNQVYGGAFGGSLSGAFGSGPGQGGAYTFGSTAPFGSGHNVFGSGCGFNGSGAVSSSIAKADKGKSCIGISSGSTDPKIDLTTELIVNAILKDMEPWERISWGDVARTFFRDFDDSYLFEHNNLCDDHGFSPGGSGDVSCENLSFLAKIFPPSKGAEPMDDVLKRLKEKHCKKGLQSGEVIDPNIVLDEEKFPRNFLNSCHFLWKRIVDAFYESDDKDGKPVSLRPPLKLQEHRSNFIVTETIWHRKTSANSATSLNSHMTDTSRSTSKNSVIVVEDEDDEPKTSSVLGDGIFRSRWEIVVTDSDIVLRNYPQDLPWRMFVLPEQLPNSKDMLLLLPPVNVLISDLKTQLKTLLPDAGPTSYTGDVKWSDQMGEGIISPSESTFIDGKNTVPTSAGGVGVIGKLASSSALVTGTNGALSESDLDEIVMIHILNSISTDTLDLRSLQQQKPKSRVHSPHSSSRSSPKLTSASLAKMEQAQKLLNKAPDLRPDVAPGINTGGVKRKRDATGRLRKAVENTDRKDHHRALVESGAEASAAEGSDAGSCVLSEGGSTANMDISDRKNEKEWSDPMGENLSNVSECDTPKHMDLRDAGSFDADDPLDFSKSNVDKMLGIRTSPVPSAAYLLAKRATLLSSNGIPEESLSKYLHHERNTALMIKTKKEASMGELERIHHERVTKVEREDREKKIGGLLKSLRLLAVILVFLIGIVLVSVICCSRAAYKAEIQQRELNKRLGDDSTDMDSSDSDSEERPARNEDIDWNRIIGIREMIKDLEQLERDYSGKHGDYNGRGGDFSGRHGDFPNRNEDFSGRHEDFFSVKNEDSIQHYYGNFSDEEGENEKAVNSDGGDCARLDNNAINYDTLKRSTTMNSDFSRGCSRKSDFIEGKSDFRSMQTNEDLETYVKEAKLENYANNISEKAMKKDKSKWNSRQSGTGVPFESSSGYQPSERSEYKAATGES